MCWPPYSWHRYVTRSTADCANCHCKLKPYCVSGPICIDNGDKNSLVLARILDCQGEDNESLQEAVQSRVADPHDARFPCPRHRSSLSRCPRPHQEGSPEADALARGAARRAERNQRRGDRPPSRTVDGGGRKEIWSPPSHWPTFFLFLDSAHLSLLFREAEFCYGRPICYEAKKGISADDVYARSLYQLQQCRLYSRSWIYNTIKERICSCTVMWFSLAIDSSDKLV